MLRKSIVEMKDPVVEGPLGRPPFESPTIAKAISNFVLARFSSSPKVSRIRAAAPPTYRNLNCKDILCIVVSHELIYFATIRRGHLPNYRRWGPDAQEAFPNGFPGPRWDLGFTVI